MSQATRRGQWIRRRDLIALIGSVAVAAPLAARAQQKPMAVIGFLSSASPVPPPAFRQGLGETGYVEGQNVAIESRSAEGSYDRLPALAADLVGRKVDMVVTVGGIDSARAAKAATATIPIVFLVGTDPVEDGLVASLARPGENLTGISLLIGQLYAKRLELVSELVPQAGVIAMLVDPKTPATERNIKYVQEAASAKGLRLFILRASTATEIDAAFAVLAEQKAGALIVSATPFLDTRREQLLELTARHAVPAIYAFREFPASGGLISYGASLTVIYRELGIYAGKILEGAKPADLPVQQPTKFELIINLKTAKALGLTVPQQPA